MSFWVGWGSARWFSCWSRWLSRAVAARQCLGLEYPRWLLSYVHHLDLVSWKVLSSLSSWLAWSSVYGSWISVDILRGKPQYTSTFIKLQLAIMSADIPLVQPRVDLGGGHDTGCGYRKAVGDHTVRWGPLKHHAVLTCQRNSSTFYRMGA